MRKLMWFAIGFGLACGYCAYCSPDSLLLPLVLLAAFGIFLGLHTRQMRPAELLCFGCALGLCWFHADVDMPKAQFAVYEALTGEPPRDARLITIPYAAGVALGVAVFYALPSRKATTPLEVKLTEYQSDMEQTEARDID